MKSGAHRFFHATGANFVSYLITHPSSFLPVPLSVHYTCQRCTACCRWPGLVKVGDGEIAAMAQLLDVTEYNFVQRYTRLRPNRDGLSLIEKENGECVFLEGRDCVVQAAKPIQCAGFPNTWNFPGWREACEAVPSLKASA
jgi:Fe-S-cluster containining protein